MDLPALKRIAGEILWYATAPSSGLRRIASPLGMRIRSEWLGSRIARVGLANGRIARLAGVAQSYMTFELHWKGWRYFSPYSILTLERLLSGAGTFYDIGANIGYYSLFAASAPEALQVVAFEPNPGNFALLAANAALNGSRIQCVHAAVSDATGRAVLHVPRSNLSGSLEAAFNPDILDTVEVHAYRLDDYVERRTPTGRLVLKAIVEGHEPKLLRGARRVLEEQRPDMILAVTQRYDDETITLLQDRGYAFYAITDLGLRPEDHLDVCLRGDRFFLEHLVTTRTRDEVAAIGDHVIARSASIRQEETNTHRVDLRGKRAVW
jgi:FkbM family methyltransferase